MSIKAIAILILCLPLAVCAQQNFFEGQLDYKVTIKSKRPFLSARDAGIILAMGDSWSSICKNGNFKLHTNYCDTYIILKDKKQYLKFKAFDTLYSLNYDFDTSRVLEIVEDPGSYKVTGYDCKALTLKTAGGFKQYFYTSALVLNPEYNKDNTIGHYNIYSRETGGGVYLLTKSETGFCYETDSCVKVSPGHIDDHVFDLPNLPIKEYDPMAMIKMPKFRGGDKAWLKYLEGSLDSKLAAKYVKLPKGQKEASEQVIIEFMVREDGSLIDFHVTNEKEVNSKLAKEALRVVSESGRWEPASFFGQKVSFIMRQPVVFKVIQE